jgi:succinate dehydrogenase / fumarate reductase cytochrome b subunit
MGGSALSLPQFLAAQALHPGLVKDRSVVFLFMHISSLRWGWSYGGLMPSFDAHHAASTTALHLQGGLFPYFNAAFYAVCVLALVFHFANGLWTAAITWGLTVSKQAQQRWGVVCAGVGVALAAAGMTAVVGFATLDAAGAKDIETKMQGSAAQAPDVQAAGGDESRADG